MDPAKWHNLGYLFWAYLAVWGLLALYLGLMTQRMSRLRREIDALQRKSKTPAGD